MPRTPKPFNSLFGIRHQEGEQEVRNGRFQLPFRDSDEGKVECDAVKAFQLPFRDSERKAASLEMQAAIFQLPFRDSGSKDQGDDG